MTCEAHIRLSVKKAQIEASYCFTSAKGFA
jgi:hypothetical protein